MTCAGTYSVKGIVENNRTAQIKKYLPLVKRIAGHIMSRVPANIEIDDMVQVGLIGLNESFDRFDPEQGFQFETFASNRIRGAMLDELRGNDFMSRDLRKQQKSIESAIVKAEQKHGRKAGESEIALEMGLTLKDYQDVLYSVRSAQLIHIEDMGGNSEDEGDSFLDRFLGSGDETSNPMSIMINVRMRKALVEAIEGLPERERLVMGLYYEQEMTLKEIGTTLVITESRVCQILSQVTAKLRVRLKQH